MRQSLKRGALLALLAVLLLAGGVLLFAGNEQSTPRTWPEALEQYHGEPAYKSVDPSKPLHEQTRIISLAERRFNMPIIYVDAPLDPDEVQDGLLLIYVLPTYRSRLEFTNKEEYEQSRKAGHFGQMLIEPEEVRPSFEVMVENMHRSVTKIEQAGTFDGLEVEKWYRPDGDKLEHVSDVYLEKDSSGHIVSWIDCGTTESAVVPQCNHKFRDKALLYDIYYNKANYLDEWRKQRESAVSFIERFEITGEEHITKEN